MLSIGLVGATNVGKSTLFNRLIKQYRAIVTNIAGTTTDIVRQTSELKGIGKVSFVDSPGLLDFTEEWAFIKQIIDEEDLLLFVIDDSVGITAKEQHIFSYIMEQNKKQNTILVVNKLDVNHSEKDYDLALAEYYSLGFEHVIGVSAKKEKNIDEIVDVVKKILPPQTPQSRKAGQLPSEGSPSRLGPPSEGGMQGGSYQQEEEPENMIKLAIVGKPNAGKSTLLNQITKQYLAKVEDKAGTTRDYIVGDFERKGQQFTIYDTAGIKKKGKIHGIERIAYEKIKKMLQYVRPIVIFMIDIAAGISHRDLTLLAEIEHMGLPLIIGLNKIDLLEEKNRNTLQSIKTHLKIAKYIPVVPMSALHGDGKERLLNMVSKVHVENTKRIDTNELNSMISHEWLQRPPRFAKNKVCKILYITQVDIDAPTFMIFVNHSKRINFALKRWIENSIRKYYHFDGVPLILKFKDRDTSKSEKEEREE